MYEMYVFSLVLGGGFLLLSVLGDMFGADAADMDFDADVDVSVELDGDVDVDHDWAHVSKLLSFRTIVYTFFGFGAVGWLLTMAGFAPAAPLTLASATVGGLASGALVQTVFGYLKRTDSGEVTSEDAFVGLPAVVTLPLGGSSAGNIAVEHEERRITLRALPHRDVPDEVMKKWKDVVIVDMRDGVARVAPVDGDLLAPPDPE